jgi:pimeloyl-ACP methyl ester carboxylesterase
MAEQIPGARLCMVADAGHMVNMEQPDAFNAGLIDFLRAN